MSFMDFVSVAVKKTAYTACSKSRREEEPVFPDAVKTVLTGKDGYNVGFAVKNITPENLLSHTYWMAGYGIAKKITGFLDPLTVSAMWIDCDCGGIVLVSCDLIGLTGCDVNKIRDSLSGFCRVTGCKHISISCTHTHAGIDTMGYWGPLPKTGKDKDFMIAVEQSIGEVCREAYKERKHGSLYYGNILADGLAHRWRQPYFCVPLLHRLRFVPDDGSKETWYLNFPAHPNTLGGKNKLLSADYPCYMRREIKMSRDVNVLYSVGAIGAVDIGEVAKDNTERTMLGGALLGKKALEIENDELLAPEIVFSVQKFVIPLDNPVLVLANALRVFSTKKCAAASLTGAGLISEMTYISFGKAKILTMPGETFQELIYPGGYFNRENSSTGEAEEVNPTPVTEIFGDKNLMIFGVTNDMAGYALARNDFVLHKTQPFLSRGTDRFGRNHYHETNSCGINTGDVLIKACKKIKNSL